MRTLDAKKLAQLVQEGNDDVKELVVAFLKQEESLKRAEEIMKALVKDIGILDAENRLLKESV